MDRMKDDILPKRTETKTRKTTRKAEKEEKWKAEANNSGWEKITKVAVQQTDK